MVQKVQQSVDQSSIQYVYALQRKLLRNRVVTARFLISMVLGVCMCHPMHLLQKSTSKYYHLLCTDNEEQMAKVRHHMIDR